MTESAAASQPPIFILSCYRTGSTLLRYILDTHPDIYCPPELYLGPAAFHLLHFASGLATAPFDWDTPKAGPPEVLAWARTVLAERLDRAAAAKGKRRWCEKSPVNLFPGNLRLLDALFPEARYICLHRHCLDMSQSLIKMMHQQSDLPPFIMASEGNPVRAAVDYWNERTFTSLTFEMENRSRCFRLRYEDLVAQPAKVLEPLCKFLGAAWDPRLLDAIFSSQHDRGEEDHYILFTDSIHARSVGAGRNLAIGDLPEKSLRTMRSLLAELGYPELPVPLVTTAPQRQPAAGALPRPQWFFETHIVERLRAEPQLAASIRSSYRFVVRGDGEGSWVIRPQEKSVAAGSSPADCSVELTAVDLFAIASGELHPWKAAEQGKVRIQGNTNTQELQSLMQLIYLRRPAALAQ